MRLKRSGGAGTELLVAVDDVSRFEGLADELAAEYPAGGWRAVPRADLRAALSAPTGTAPAAVLFCVEAAAGADPARLDDFVQLVGASRAAGAGVILLVQDLPASAVHRLMRAGADDFMPSPGPPGALGESLGRLRARRESGGAAAADPRRPRNGAVFAVYGVAGGVGATTFAVNLAWEVALEGRKPGLEVCLLDLDFQYGSVATYLDLPRGDAVYELLSDIERADAQGFRSALGRHGKRLDVLTAPADALPLDIVGPAAVTRLLELACASHDVVIVDMPRTLTLWTETVLQACQRFHAVMEIDMRSAQNMLRLLRALKAEELPVEKLDYVLNRAPGFGDFGGKGRVKKMSESLGIEYAWLLPDGGRAVAQAGDHGSPLAEFASGNALRKEIRKAARALVTEVQAQRAALQ